MIKWVKNTLPAGNCERGMALLTESALAETARFHASLPGYRETPLVSLPSLARYLGVKAFLVKDESGRFGLNSFKALGSVWAIANIIAKRAGKPVSAFPFSAWSGKAVKDVLGDVTFYSATDGNHGRGVAWTARQAAQKCVIFMPKGTSVSRLENIRKLGAEASIVDMNYDEAVRFAASEAEKHGGILVQDTDWPGYEEIPAWIMQGYGTVGFEAGRQAQKAGLAPTHIFAQAGVGSFAASFIGYFANCYQNSPPVMATVEPLTADCIARSVREGKRTAVTGDMPTIMAGLACGEPCTLSWSILRAHARFSVSLPDWVTACGMRVLAAPLPGDTQIVSGESGAAPAGLAFTLLNREGASYEELSPLREALGLGPQSVILTVSTEGDTYPEEYRRIVWEGEFASAGVCCEHC